MKTILASNQRKVPVRRKSIIIASIALLLAFTGYIHLVAPFRTIRQLETRYQRVQLGMSTKEVQTIMNHTGNWHTNAAYRGWDGQQPNDATAERQISHAVAYIVPTFFLSVTFEFVFDDSGRAVGKHRYD
jgi:hypothetical protein